ncbi:MAG: ATP-binding cassette domain-containing protein [Deltaproteobacteria bacterium]|nr:ATP-binding cassette domain-containing protein [Deltaproteobacteria bacterium]
MLQVVVKKCLGTFCLDMDFSITGLGLTVIFGKSGAGKSTLLNLLAGLIHPDDGLISCAGRIFFDSAGRVALPPEKRAVGYVFQQPRLFSHLSVQGNLLFAPRFGGRPPVEDLFQQVTELLGLADLLERRTQTLSGGESQRVSIGRALLASPTLLLMDEPLSSLDHKRKKELMHYIAVIPERFQIPVLYVTHSLEELQLLADRVLLVRDGRGQLFDACPDLSADLAELI